MLSDSLLVQSEDQTAFSVANLFRFFFCKGDAAATVSGCMEIHKISEKFLQNLARFNFKFHVEVES